MTTAVQQEETVSPKEVRDFGRLLGRCAFRLLGITESQRELRDEGWYQEAVCGISGRPLRPIDDACVVYRKQEGDYQVILREHADPAAHVVVPAGRDQIFSYLQAAHEQREEKARVEQNDDSLSSSRANGHPQLGNQAVLANGVASRKPLRSERSLRDARFRQRHR